MKGFMVVVLRDKILGGKLPLSFRFLSVKWQVVLLLVCIVPFQSYAKCDLKTPSEVLSLIKSNHPQISLTHSKKEMFEQSIEVAKQRPNPEMDLEAANGDTSDGNKFKASVSVRHVFELGDKRDSRVNLAQRSYQVQVARVDSANEDILIESIIKLYRLRQISESIPLYKEALQAFNKILNTKRKRKSLSPEEEVEKETLELATNDYRLKLSQLVSEKINLNRHISLFAGVNCEIPLKALPSKVNFKESFSAVKSTNSYSKLLAAKKRIDLAEASARYEKSLAYSDIKVGPTYEYESDNVSKNHTIGIALTMDLPIFNRNAGGKNRAVKELEVARKNFLNIEKESEYDLEAWVSKYKRFKGALNTIANKHDLQKKHQKIEKLFSRGIISTSLVIESHRQLLEFTNTRYEFELGVVEALWNIYKLNGDIKYKNI